MPDFKQTLLRTVISVLLATIFIPTFFGHPLSGSLEWLIATVVHCYGAVPFYLSGYKQIGRHTALSIGLAICYLLGFYGWWSGGPFKQYFAISSFLIAILLISQVIEQLLLKKTKINFKTLLNNQPATVRLRVEEEHQYIPVQEMGVGSFFTVGANECIPVDGVLIQGSAVVDESALIGEKRVVEKQKGEFVFAGSTNQHGTFVARATSLGNQTLLRHLSNLMDNLQTSQGKIYLACAGLIICVSLTTYLYWALACHQMPRALISAIAVLFVSCPYVAWMARSLMVAIVGQKMAQYNLRIEELNTLKEIAKLQVLIIDQENLFEKGQLQVETIALEPEWFSVAKALAEQLDTPELQAIARALTEHKVISSVLEAAKTYPDLDVYRNNLKNQQFDNKILQNFYLERETITPRHASSEDKNNELKLTFSKPDSLTYFGVEGYFGRQPYFLGSLNYLAAHGISADYFKEAVEMEKGILVAFGVDKCPLGYFLLVNRVKEAGKQAVLKLHQLGVKTHLYVKEKGKLAEGLAKAASADRVVSYLFPAEKVEQINRLKKKGFTVGIVGDSSRDELALNTANVGFALQGLSEATQMIELAKTLARKNLQNHLLNLGYHCLGIGFAVTGLLNPLIAGLCAAGFSTSLLIRTFSLKKVPKPLA